ncbi:MAG TPA: hypothetical protein VF995_03040, partial [Actinomycetota bacterium]
RVVGDAFVSAVHVGYLLSAAAGLICATLAVTLLGAFRRQPAPSTPAGTEAAAPAPDEPLRRP